MTKRFLTVLSALATSLVLAACGGGGGDTDARTSEAASDPSAAATTAEGGAAFGDDGVLQVGTDATIGLPWTSLAEGQSEIEGLDPDIATAVAEELGMEVEFVNVGFDTLIPGLESQRIDMIASAMLDTEVRREQVDFVDYLVTGSGMLVRAEGAPDVNVLADLCGLQVAVLRGSAEEAAAQETNEGDCNDDPIDVQVFPSFSNATTALQSGRVEVALGDPAQWAYLANAQPDVFKAVGEVFNAGKVGLGVRKDSGAAQSVRDALQAVIDSGRYEEILSEYGLNDNAVEEATINDGTSG